MLLSLLWDVSWYRRLILLLSLLCCVSVKKKCIRIQDFSTVIEPSLWIWLASNTIHSLFIKLFLKTMNIYWITIISHRKYSVSNMRNSAASPPPFCSIPHPPNLTHPWWIWHHQYLRLPKSDYLTFIVQVWRHQFVKWLHNADLLQNLIHRIITFSVRVEKKVIQEIFLIWYSSNFLDRDAKRYRSGTSGT